MTNPTATTEPTVLRRLSTTGAGTLVDLLAVFEDLQTVLRCCERLVSELARGAAADGSTDGAQDDVVIEAVWTMALLSYARCYSVTGAVTEDDLTAATSRDDVLDWHRVLLHLRDHYADPGANPRERFAVGVAQDADGAAGGVGVTSARQPLVDDVTVRQTGAIAYALSSLVNDRIAAQQQTVFDEVRGSGKADLDKLPRLEVAGSST